jgi:hypothetical protein
MALDSKRNHCQIVESTVELTQKAGVFEIVGRIVNGLKDEAESLTIFKLMCLERFLHKNVTALCTLHSSISFAIAVSPMSLCSLLIVLS